MCKIDNENDKNHWDRLIFALELAVNSTINMELTTYDCKYLLDKLTSLTDRITDLEAERRWVPVSERLPDPYMPVLILCSDGYMNVSIRLENDRGDITFSFDDITHWMPLLPPPEDK